MEKISVHEDSHKEALQYRWIESERAGKDLGNEVVSRWVREHWWGYLRARWIEHLHGIRFWVELDRDNYGLLKSEFCENELLLDRILDRVKTGQENLDIIGWALDWNVRMGDVLQVLERLDINSRRIACKFGGVDGRA